MPEHTINKHTHHPYLHAAAWPGDVLKPGACEEALRGAQALLHLAAVVKILADKQEQQAMVDTALQGTRNVLGRASRVATCVMLQLPLCLLFSTVVGCACARWSYVRPAWAKGEGVPGCACVCHRGPDVGFPACAVCMARP